MAIENIKKVAVIGAGGMGSGIAEICSRLGGYDVMMCDTTQEQVQRGLDNQQKNLQRFFVDKSKITAAELDAIIGRIRLFTSISEAVKEADIVIEAVFESMELKKKVFSEIDGAAPAHCIIASNTSNLSVTEMAAFTKRAEQVGGMHFFNPVAVMKLVEVVRAALTSDDTSKTIYDLSLKLNKEPVYCRDTYGFLANRATKGGNEAVELVWAHVATPADIDKAVRLGYNRPVGPLELSDMIGGWSLSVHAEDDSIKEFGWEKGHVHPLVKLMVRAGYTGGQGKKGIYDFWNDVLSKW